MRQKDMFDIFRGYHSACWYLMAGVIGWLLFLSRNHTHYFLLDAFFLLIGSIGLPYGIFRLVNIIINHVNFKKHDSKRTEY
jgi:hypothetical protein